MVLCEFESFEIFTDSMSLKIFHGILFCFVEMIGFICYAGIAHFEYYGGDPMKRSLDNQLVAQMCNTYVFHFFTSNPSFAWRIIVGSLNPELTPIIQFCRECINTYLYLCLTEIVIFKIVILFAWKHFCFFDESFVSCIVTRFNIFFSITTHSFRWILGSYKNNEFELLTGVFANNNHSNYGFFWPIFLLMVFSIIIIGYLTLFIKKYMEHQANLNMVEEIHIRLEDQNASENQFNNVTHNIPIVKTYEIAMMGINMLCILLCFFTFPTLIGFEKEFAIYQWILITEISTEYFFGIVVPIYILIRKDAIRAHLWTILKKLFFKLIQH